MTSIKTSHRTYKSMSDRAYDEIREMILDLRLLPGQTVLIEELAESLDMSRTPVRQAITRLTTETESLVEKVPRKGIVVSMPSVQSMREIYEVMDGLNMVVARLAIDRADEEVLDALEHNVVQQQQAIEQNNRSMWVEADREFHNLLFEAAGNGRLNSLRTLYNDQLQRMSRATIHLRSLNELSEATSDHMSIFAALRTRDKAALATWLEQHSQRGKENMVRAIEEYRTTIALMGVNALS